MGDFADRAVFNWSKVEPPDTQDNTMTDFQAKIAELTADMMRQRDKQIHQAFSELPEPPEGFRWMVEISRPDFHSLTLDNATNQMSHVTEERFQFKLVDTTPPPTEGKFTISTRPWPGPNGHDPDRILWAWVFSAPDLDIWPIDQDEVSGAAETEAECHAQIDRFIESVINAKREVKP